MDIYSWYWYSGNNNLFNFVLFIVTIATSLPLLIIVSIVFSSIFLKFAKVEGNKKEAPLLEQEDYE